MSHMGTVKSSKYDDKYNKNGKILCPSVQRWGKTSFTA